MRDAAEARSQLAALTITAALATALLLKPPHPAPSQQGVTALAVELAPPAPPTPPAPPMPPQPKPLPQPVPPRAHAASPQRRAAAPRPPSPAPAVEVAAVPSPAPDPAAAPAAASPPAAAPAPPDPSAENRYLGMLHAYVQSITYPPQSAEYRLLKPSGIVLMAFTLTRAGALAGLRLLRSSGSSILDQQALRIIGSGRYPPFPDDVYRGQDAHEFSTPIRFEPAANAEP